MAWTCTNVRQLHLTLTRRTFVLTAARTCGYSEAMQKPTITTEVTLAEYVDLMRVRKDMTRADLAQHMGVQPRTLATWAEQGWQVRADRIVQVCSLLDLDPKIFLPTGQ